MALTHAVLPNNYGLDKDRNSLRLDLERAAFWQAARGKLKFHKIVNHDDVYIENR
jgi:hypothetical protein